MYINKSLINLLNLSIAFPLINIEVRLKDSSSLRTIILNSYSRDIKLFQNNLRVNFQNEGFRILNNFQPENVTFKVESKKDLDNFAGDISGKSRDFFAQSNNEDLLNKICSNDNITKPFEKMSQKIISYPLDELLNFKENEIGLNIINLHTFIYKELLKDKFNYKGQYIGFTQSLTIILSAYSKDSLVKTLLSIQEQALNKSYLKHIKVIVTKSLDPREQNDDLFYQIVEYTKPNTFFSIEYIHKEFSEFLRTEINKISTDLVMLIKGTNTLLDANFLCERLMKHHILSNFITLQLFGSDNVYFKEKLEDLRHIIFEEGSIMFPRVLLDYAKDRELRI